MAKKNDTPKKTIVKAKAEEVKEQVPVEEPTPVVDEKPTEDATQTPVPEKPSETAPDSTDPLPESTPLDILLTTISTTINGKSYLKNEEIDTIRGAFEQYRNAMDAANNPTPPSPPAAPVA